MTTKHRPEAWLVVPNDPRGFTIRSYEDGDNIDQAFVVVRSTDPDDIVIPEVNGDDE